ncbi:MAG: AAA family ATPase [bacterium]
MIIGITGTFGAGKDTVAEYLEKEKEFKAYSLSDAIRDECRQLNLPIDRDTLQKVGNDLRAKSGLNVLAQRIIQKINQEGQRNAQITSVRNPGEWEEIKKTGQAYLISVDAPIELRFQRIKGRQRIDDNIDFEKFKAQEELEQQSTDPASQQLKQMAEMADYTIVNDKTLEELYRKVDEVLEKIQS